MPNTPTKITTQTHMINICRSYISAAILVPGSGKFIVLNLLKSLGYSLAPAAIPGYRMNVEIHANITATLLTIFFPHLKFLIFQCELQVY